MCYILVILKDEFIIFQFNVIASFFSRILLLTCRTCLLASSYCLQGMRVKTALTRFCDQTQIQSNPPQMKQVTTEAILPSDVLSVTQLLFSTTPPLYCTATETTLLNIVLEKTLTSNVFLV